MPEHIAGLLRELEWLAESDEPCDFDSINTSDLSEDEQEAVRQIKTIMANYKAALEIQNERNETQEITDFKNAKNRLNKRLAQESIMTLISQSFLSTGDIDKLIANALGIIGEFIGISQILLYIIEDDNNTFVCRSEWMDPVLGLQTRVGDTIVVADSKILSSFIAEIKISGVMYRTSDDAEFKKIMTPYRRNFHKYLFTSIFLGDRLYAILDFSQKDESCEWSYDDINMISLFSNILTGVFQKNLMELELINAKELAEKNNRYKSIFLASMSHEIRTPINAILGIAEIQLLNKTLSPSMEDAFNKIYDSGDLLLNIINDILDFSKIEAGKLEIVPVKYDIPSLINDSMQIIRLRYESKPLDFKLYLDANTPLDLFGDELRIKQILTNLLSNAFKYTDKGEIIFSVYAEPLQTAENPLSSERHDMITLVLQVKDTGQGMTEEQVSRIFDEYTRFNMQTNRSIAGTGLGLNITKRFIDMMDGEILVESEPNKGSVFTVRLPQKCTSPEVCGAELADKLQNSDFRSISKTAHKIQIIREYMPYGSVLVVDDVESNLFVAKGLMIPYGLQIETATSGFEVIEKIKAGNVYDIIFMDHMMPRLDGIETTKIIREMGYASPIAALTANAVVGQAEIFFANGFDGFLSKPIDLRELNAMLNDFIRDKQPPEVIEAARCEKSNTNVPAQEIFNSPQIETAFLLDAEKAVAVLEEIHTKLKAGKEADIHLYVISTHGMKSAFANICETELSRFAFKLETAGRNKDYDIILDETPAFLNALKTLITKIRPAANVEDEDDDKELSDEDKIYLREKIDLIKTACANFDKKSIKTAIEDLKQKDLPRRTFGILDTITVHLLHSAFKKISDIADDILS